MTAGVIGKFTLVDRDDSSYLRCSAMAVLCVRLKYLVMVFRQRDPFYKMNTLVFFHLFSIEKKINASSQIAADTKLNSTNSPHCNRPVGHSCQMEVAAPKGWAGLVLPGVLTVVNRPVPSHLPKFISRPRLHHGSDRSNLPHLSESLLLLERDCSCRDQCGSVGCLFVSYQSASGTILCVCVRARTHVCVCAALFIRYAAFLFFQPVSDS